MAQEISVVKAESKSFQDEKESTEKKYRYDVRILNVLATTGLKASSIAHELKNDRNSVSVNYQYIVEALKEYGFWEDLMFSIILLIERLLGEKFFFSISSSIVSIKATIF